MTPAGLDAGGTCPACAGRRFAFDRVIRLGIYAGPMRAAVLRMKKDENRPLAEGVGRLLLAMRAIDLARLEASLVVPIPMYWWRRYRRGTNSARTVAEVLARRLELPLLPRLLVRRRNTLPHSNLSPEARRRNVRDAFAASRRYNINGLGVLLVDDILTTGATCHAAARELRRAGAREVTVAVAARAEGIA
jgi:ComF family protein